MAAVCVIKQNKNRKAFRLAVFVLSVSWLLSGCGQQTNNPLLPAGSASTYPIAFHDLELPVSNMPADRQADIMAGKALAHQPWVKAPTATTARDGLGPLYNARTCLACHISGGRGTVPADNQSQLFSALLRISISGENNHTLTTSGVIPHPLYGDQLQTQSTALMHQLKQQSPSVIAASGDVAPEARVYLNWQEKVVTYPDGQQITLRFPEADIRELAYGPTGPAAVSLRVAPAIHGMGLIELINQQDINQLADPEDNNNDGISGRVNRVWDARSQSTMPGRFGLKANKPTLEMTIAGAFANDLGISNPLFPSQPCTAAQQACLKAANGNNAEGFELPEKLLQSVVAFNRHLGVPARTEKTQKNTATGAELFRNTGCSLCHQPDFVTAKSTAWPLISNQTIWPFSDFLLHDMGAELADNRTDFLASGSEWRTAPLWGMASVLAISQRFHGTAALLHDGRARSVEEAVLWHGGEASAVREHFMQLAKAERAALIAFVNSL